MSDSPDPNPGETHPYPDNPGGTHYVGCYRSRGHHNCAVARVDELEAVAIEVERARIYLRDSSVRALALIDKQRETLLAAINGSACTIPWPSRALGSAEGDEA